MEKVAARTARNEAQFSRDPRNWRWHYEGLLSEHSALLGISPREPCSSSYHHDGEKRRRLREPLDDRLAALPEMMVVAQVEEVSMRLIDALGSTGEADLVRVRNQLARSSGTEIY